MLNLVFDMFTRKPKHFTGLDHSGECKVLPPTFLGVRNLVERVGQDMAEQMYSQKDDIEEDASRDIVRDFLSELRYADKVERQTLINDFRDYVSDLQAASSPAPEAKEEPEEKVKPEPAKAEPAPEGDD